MPDHCCEYLHLLSKSNELPSFLTWPMEEGAISMSAIALTGVSAGAQGTWLKIFLKPRGGLLRAEMDDPE